MNTIYHAWFSIKQLHAGKMGIARYRSVHGHIVAITEVTKDNKPVGDFDDFVYLGKVDKLIEPFPALNMSKSFFRERAAALYEKMKFDNDREEARLFAEPHKINNQYRYN